MTRDEILADMRGLFGRKTMLSPADIAVVVAQSEGAQAVARHRGRFDIPIRKRGRNVYVSLYDLVDWLQSQSPDRPEPAGAIEPAKSNPKSASSGASKPGRPRRPSLASALVFARQALDFDAQVFAALEALSLEAEAAKTDRKRRRPSPPSLRE